jgi:hypothetical protein
MPLTLAQRDALTTNAAFVARCRQAVAARAQFNLVNNAASAQQKAWASNMFFAARLAQATANMMPQLCTDGAVTGSAVGDGSDITDAALLGAAQTYCESYD